MEVLTAVGLWILLVFLLLGSLLLYIKANTEKRGADKIYSLELKQEKQTSSLTWRYRWVKALAGVSGMAYFCSYLLAGNLLNLFWLTLLFMVMFLAALGAADAFEKKLSIYADTGIINSVAYLGYFCATLQKLGVLDNPWGVMPAYAQIVKKNTEKTLEGSQSSDWFLIVIATLVVFLTSIFTLVLLSTALMYVVGVRDYPGYSSAEEAIHKWHRENLNSIMHRADFERLARLVYKISARKAKARQILQLFGACSLAGNFFPWRAIFTAANVLMSFILAAWGTWALIPNNIQDNVKQLVTKKIISIQFQEWDSLVSIFTGAVLIIGILFAYFRVEKLPPIFRSYNFDRAVEKLSELYTGYSNLLDVWYRHYKSNIAVGLNDTYQEYLEQISGRDLVVGVSGVYKFERSMSSFGSLRNVDLPDLEKRLDDIDKIFENIHNKTETAPIARFLAKENLLLGYLSQYKFINGISKFSEGFIKPGDFKLNAEEGSNRFDFSYYETTQRSERVREETRSFIVRTETSVLLTYLRIAEVQRTVYAISKMHRKSRKERIAEAVGGK